MAGYIKKRRDVQRLRCKARRLDCESISRPRFSTSHPERAKEQQNRKFAATAAEGQGIPIVDREQVRLMRRLRQPDETVKLYKEKALSYLDIPKSWKAITTDTVIVVDRELGETVAVIRVSPFSEVSEQHNRELLEMIEHFESDARMHPVVRINGASKDGHGSMGCIGFRKAMVQGEAFGTYTKGQNVSSQSWSTLRQRDGLVHQTLGRMFKSLAPKICRDHQELMSYLKLPFAGYGIAHVKDTNATITKDDNLFTPQIVYTRRNSKGHFSNRCHRDNDASEYTYGIWLPVITPPDTDDSTTAVSKLGLMQDGFDQKGGQFYNAQYEFFIDFPNINGIVECVWRGAKDYHGTATAEFSCMSHYRLGCSTQINSRLACAVKKWWSNGGKMGNVRTDLDFKS